MHKINYPPEILNDFYNIACEKGCHLGVGDKLLLKEFLEEYPFYPKIVELIIDEFLFQYYSKPIDFNLYN